METENTMRVTLIRHGKTRGNIERRFCGCRTDEPLTEEGRSALKCIDGAAEDSLIFVSPMLRARETAGILFPGRDLIEVDELKEMDFGIFEPHNHEELDGNPDYQAWIDSGGTMQVPGGESMKSFVQRTMTGLAKAVKHASSNDTDEIYIVAHGGTIMSVMGALTHLNYYDFLVENGCGFTFDLEVDDAGNIVAAGTYDSFRSGVRAGSSDRGSSQNASSGKMDRFVDRIFR